MNRRYFLSRSAKTAAGLALTPLAAQAFTPYADVKIRIDSKRILRTVPSDFTGLGYEISSAAVPGLFAASDKTYIQLVQNLGHEGVLRIGGNTSDFASFESEGIPISATHGTVINRKSLSDLRSFLDATGWKAIWGLNLGTGTVEAVVTEAAAVSSALGDRLHSLEIGNEPDHFGGGPRAKGWNYSSYLADFREYKSAIRARIPQARFAGPDVAGSTNWVASFANDEGSDLTLLTEHYYIGDGNSDKSTIGLMLQPNAKLASFVKQLEGISATSKVPYRICETNSFYNGGKAGVSNTFGSALWVLDYMFTLCSAGAAGVNLQTGVNHRGFVSYYSPIKDDGHGRCYAAPEYYGMLAFAHGSNGNQIAMEVGADSVNLTAYAVVQDDRQVILTLINKDLSTPAKVSVSCDERLRDATLIRLSAPSVESMEGILLGGSEVTRDGQWRVSKHEPVRVAQGIIRLEVPATSAALVSIKY